MRTKEAIIIIGTVLGGISSSHAQNWFPASGNAGVGTTTPTDLLEVSGGDIHISNGFRAYRLGQANFLWHNGKLKSVFAGVGTGNSTLTSDGNTLLGAAVGPDITTGEYNTSTGHASGLSLTTGSYNTFTGESAGRLNTTGSDNALFGRSAGQSNVTGSSVTALGSFAGFNNTVSNNTFVGFEAGRSSTTGTENTFIGHLAGRDKGSTGSFNTVTGFEAGLGAGNAYNYNSFYGSRAGRANTSGQLNTYVGYNAGPVNTSGSLNVFVGAGAGSSNTSGGQCTMVGYLSGMSNTTGTNNTFLGYHAGRYNVNGQNNVFIGHQAGRENTTGNQNVYIGNNTGFNNTTGAGNTAIGFQCGDFGATGSNNTFLGHQADANGIYTNAAAIGRGAVVTASNTMYYGNASVTHCYTAGIWQGSDERFKFNVNENVSGLDFIKRLRPVTYQMNTAELDAFLRANMPQSEDSTGEGTTDLGLDFGPSMEMIHAGFIAQEVEEAAAQSGFVSSIVSTPRHDNDHYALSYAQFVVPLVKAVQEQQDTIEDLSQSLAQLEQALAQMQEALSQCCGSADAKHRPTGGDDEPRTMTVELSSADSPVLYQNRPNPFTDGTVIAYYLPSTVKAAVMVFHDQSGQTLREVTLTDRGHASITLQAERLAAGVYTYSLVADGRTVETRRMVKGN